MYKFLVIDDDQKRDALYSTIFNFIELDFAFNLKEFLTKIKEEYDGYFIDIIYDSDSFERYSFQQILENIPERKPIFLISNQWERAMDQMKMKSLRSCGKYSDVLGYFSWDSIKENSQIEFARDFAKEQMDHYYDRAYEAFDEDQSISILQISDIEFGNPEQMPYVSTEGANLIGKVRKYLRDLKMGGNTVDFICICGDVAYTGDKKQYSKAKEWLVNLGKELLTNKNFENMLIVPGNHDYCFNAAAGNFVYYNRDSKDYESREGDDNLEFHEHAMYNFAKFVYELNGDMSYLLSPYKPIIKRTYENYGLNFILLNPVRTQSDKKFVYGLEDSAMKYLLEMGEKMGSDVCNIVLSHFAPEKYSMVDPTADATDRNIKKIADALHIKGWFYGHAHEDESVDDRKVGNNKVLISRTQSLMLQNGQHCEGSGNGFTLFKLYRKNGKVNQISYYNEKKQKEEVYDKLFAE